jgi:hypothetical protein
MVHHIAVPLETCKFGDDAKAVRRRMEEKNFDVLGATENGVIRGYVRRQDLTTGRCQSSVKQFSTADILASTTPLVETLPLLRIKPHLFILDRTKMTGLVTRADLQKSAVRMLLFGLVSLLETYLLAMVRICYPADSFAERLPPGREAKARALFASRKEANEEIDLADGLKLSDKYNLLMQVPGFPAFFRLEPAKDALHRFKSMESLRDRLAHGQDLTTGSCWEDVLAVADAIEALLRECDAKREEFMERFGTDTDVTV